MVEVHQKIEALHVGGADEGTKSERPLVVRSHWNRDDLVILRLGDGEEIAVRAKELRAAVENATNTARF